MWSSISRSIRERSVRKKLEQRNRELEDRVAQLEKAVSAPRPQPAVAEVRPVVKLSLIHI